MFEPSKISDAFLTESRLDLLSAKLLFDKGTLNAIIKRSRTNRWKLNSKRIK